MPRYKDHELREMAESFLEKASRILSEGFAISGFEQLIPPNICQILRSAGVDDQTKYLAINDVLRIHVEALKILQNKENESLEDENKVLLSVVKTSGISAKEEYFEIIKSHFEPMFGEGDEWAHEARIQLAESLAFVQSGFLDIEEYAAIEEVPGSIVQITKTISDIEQSYRNR